MNHGRRVLSLLTALAMAGSMVCTAAWAAPDKVQVYASEHARGASAIYAANGAQATLTEAQITGSGSLSAADNRSELASKYGYAAAVLAAGEGTVITLNYPTVVTTNDSDANGVFATCKGKVLVVGGTISTDSNLGHGLDTTYGGIIEAEDTVISTKGLHSGALATDFGGGFITVTNVTATTEQPGSPAIYTAGSSVITATDSKFVSKGCEAVMAAHSGGQTILYNCEIEGGTYALNGHQAMEAEVSYITVSQGSLKSNTDALINQENGRTHINLFDTQLLGHGEGANLIQTQAGQKGKLIVQMSGVDASGDKGGTFQRGDDETYLELVLNEGTQFTGSGDATRVSVSDGATWDVTGNSTVVELEIDYLERVTAQNPVVIGYNKLTVGEQEIGPEGLVSGNVTFTFIPDLVSNFSEEVQMGPPPGGMPGGPDGMPSEGMPGGPGATDPNSFQMAEVTEIEGPVADVIYYASAYVLDGGQVIDNRGRADWPFDDVSRGPETDTAYVGIRSAVEAGLMRGVTEDTFAPDRAITYAELATILARTEGVTLEAGTPWYAPAVAWAESKGLPQAGNPNAGLSGSDFAAIVTSYAASRGVTPVLPELSETVTRSDAAGILIQFK